MRFCVKKCAGLFFLCVIAFPCLAKEAKDTTPVPYTDDEFPQFMKDLRRAEIISFGALPFVTLTSTIVYSSARYAQHGFDSAYFPNPFAKASATNGYSAAEQAGILLTSAGISVGIGLTDLLISVIRRKAAKKKLERKEKAPVIITPIAEDKDAVRIDMPSREAPSGGAQGDSVHPDEETQSALQDAVPDQENDSSVVSAKSTAAQLNTGSGEKPVRAAEQAAEADFNQADGADTHRIDISIDARETLSSGMAARASDSGSAFVRAKDNGAQTFFDKNALYAASFEYALETQSGE